MNILHLTSDAKWTGPAEPMLRMALGLRERGHRVELGCPDPPARADRSLLGEASAAGLEPRLVFRGGGREVGRLREFVEREQIDLVHSWHTDDHRLALAATASLRKTGRLCLVRSYRKAERIRRWPWNRWLFGRGCDGLVCVSPETARRNRALRRGRPITHAYASVDLERFSPARPDPAVRERLGLAADHRVLGIVARVQARRRFDLLLEAAARLFGRDPLARLLIVGRGTRRRELAEEPARRLGIADRVVFAGYRREDYVDVLRAIDVFTYLVPGSDGGCRAVLEAAACGIPAVTTRRGALWELVANGRTGLVVDEHPGALLSAWCELLGEPERRHALGRAARERALRDFRPERVAEGIEAFYEEVREDVEARSRPPSISRSTARSAISGSLPPGS